MTAGSIQTVSIELHLDAHGNILAVRNPDGGIDRKSFDGQQRCYDQVDAVGRRTFQIFDGNGNIMRKYVFEQTYDPISGNITHKEVFIHIKEYDEFNREVRHIDPYG